MVLASTSPAQKHKRKSLRLPTAVAQWFEAETQRIAKVERLEKFFLTGLLYRIASADLDFTNDAIGRYRSLRPKKSKSFK